MHIIRYLKIKISFNRRHLFLYPPSPLSPLFFSLLFQAIISLVSLPLRLTVSFSSRFRGWGGVGASISFNFFLFFFPSLSRSHAPSFFPFFSPLSFFSLSTFFLHFYLLSLLFPPSHEFTVHNADKV